MDLSPLINHIRNYISLEFSDADLLLLQEYIPIVHYKKGSILLKEGEISKDSYFNFRGCVRMFYNINGVEKTANFYTENKFITVFDSYTQKKPSEVYLECIEDCTLAKISFDSEQELLKKFPKLEVLSRLILEEELSTYQNIVATFVSLSPEERYVNLMENRPELLNRIPQYYLSSYLGVSPESLSRIRKRIFSK
jgi:CRP-like cAMP-binding protein